MMRRVVMYLMMSMLALSMFSCCGCRDKSVLETPPAPVAETQASAPTDDDQREPGTGAERYDLVKLGYLKNIYFDFDKSNIRADQMDEADANAAWLKEHADLDIIIEGHCDQRGTVEYNLGLGTRRAESMKDYFVNKGVGADMLQTISKGKEEPAVDGTTEDAYALNRRVEFFSTTPPPAK